MSVGSKIYGVYVRRNPTEMRRRKKNSVKHKCGKTSICPFTLEAIKDCVVRKKRPRTVCLFSLEACLGCR